MADLTEAELHALQLLADKQAGASVAFLNIAAARTLTDLGFASRTREGWEITAEGGAELARRASLPSPEGPDVPLPSPRWLHDRPRVARSAEADDTVDDA